MNDQLPLAEELTRVYAQIAGFLLSEETVQTALELVTSLALDTIPGAVGAGVTLLDETGHKESAASTSDVVARADDLQYELDEGPCLTACLNDELIRIDDLESDLRWPRWREQALPLGLRSSLSAPLRVPGRAMGALKIYGEAPNTFDVRAENLLERFAEQATILLSNVSTLDRAERLSTDLQRALRSRNVIALASGVLMERHHLTEDQAFLRLVEDARGRGVELADEAATVVTSASTGPE
jgi:GAF domain-containing protein